MKAKRALATVGEEQPQEKQAQETAEASVVYAEETQEQPTKQQTQEELFDQAPEDK